VIKKNFNFGKDVHMIYINIITSVDGRPVHGTATYRCDDTRCCI